MFVRAAVWKLLRYRGGQACTVAADAVELLSDGIRPTEHSVVKDAVSAPSTLPVPLCLCSLPARRASAPVSSAPPAAPPALAPPASADDGATDEEDAPAPREEAATELDGRGVGAGVRPSPRLRGRARGA